MNRGKIAVLAVFLAPIVPGRPAAALDENDLEQLARFSSQEYFLQDKCDLAPSEVHIEKFADAYFELDRARRRGNDPGFLFWKGELERLAKEYAILSIRLPADEFCERLKSDYVAAGGEFVEKPERQNRIQ